MILYLAGDLLWASKIKGTADALSLPCRPVRSMEMLRERLADSPVKALIVDLDKAEEGLAMVRELKADPSRRIKVLAYGPHVAKDLLQQARDAGADQVLTRGAMEHGMPDILIALASA